MKAAAFAAVVIAACHAQGQIWTGAGNDNSWSTDANWDIGAPVSGVFTYLSFPGQVFRRNMDQTIPDLSLNRMSFDDTEGYELNGLPVRMIGNNARISNLTHGYAQFNNSIVLGVPLTLECTSTSPLNFLSGVMSDPDDPQRVTIAGGGGGYVQFVANQTYRGGTTVASGGNLRLAGGQPGVGDVTVDGILSGNGHVPGNITINSDGVISPGPGPINAGIITADRSLFIQGGTYRLALDEPGYHPLDSSVITVIGASLIVRGATIDVQPLSNFGVGSYRLFNIDPTIVDLTIDAVVTGLPAGYSASFDVNRSQGRVDLVVVPAPPCAALFGLALLARRRRR